MLGSTEILIVCGVIVLLFGGAAIPKFAKSLGKAKKEFKKGLQEADTGSSAGSSSETSKTS